MHVEPPPSTGKQFFERIGLERVVELIDRSPEDRRDYPHWDKVRHLEPPEGLTNEEWWHLIASARRAGRRQLPFQMVDGVPFTFGLPDRVLELLNEIDRRCAGEVRMPEDVTREGDARDHYLVNSLMEEAIRSSQLEGASTSRKVAKEMLQTGRAPRDRSETMILNNYRALEFMRDQSEEELTPAKICELQRIATEGTLENRGAAGRMQLPGEERIAVIDRNDGSVLHHPPPAEELPRRIERLCEFANDESSLRFIHPVIRAVLLHFQLAYDHPFEDGNGRTARALFYWQMRRHGYWMTEYLSISKILRDAPAKYSRSFLHTETDHGDTTYFVLYQLEVISKAIAEFDRYLKWRIRQVREIESIMRDGIGLNHRQRALLAEAIRDRDQSFTYGGHAKAHDITHETARSDLRTLADRELLVSNRAGRRHFFMAPLDLETRLQQL